jgi:IS5 family transposase
MGQISLFDNENILSALSKHGDPLERLNQSIEWKQFRVPLHKAFKKDRLSNAGRPPYDYLKMFKILILQELYNLSDSQTQFQILDRYSFKRFVGISPEDTVPDEKTIWHFREYLSENGMFVNLFSTFNSFLDKNGYKAQKGMIVDANIVEVPKQRNTRDDNKQIKEENAVPEDWKNNPPKLRQKDTDARWLTKNGEKHFGYKNHICIDNKHKLIRSSVTTPAHVHDSEALFDLLNHANSSKDLWGDSAYRSSEIEEALLESGCRSKIHKKGYRNKPLSKFQQSVNTKKSRVRARVEHVFGRMAMMHGNTLRCIGQLRAASRNAMRNLVYNLTRYETLARCI